MLLDERSSIPGEVEWVETTAVVIMASPLIPAAPGIVGTKSLRIVAADFQLNRTTARLAFRSDAGLRSQIRVVMCRVQLRWSRPSLQRDRKRARPAADPWRALGSGDR